VIKLFFYVHVCYLFSAMYDGKIPAEYQRGGAEINPQRARIDTGEQRSGEEDVVEGSPSKPSEGTGNRGRTAGELFFYS